MATAGMRTPPTSELRHSPLIMTTPPPGATPPPGFGPWNELTGSAIAPTPPATPAEPIRSPVVSKRGVWRPKPPHRQISIDPAALPAAATAKVANRHRDPKPAPFTDPAAHVQHKPGRGWTARLPVRETHSYLEIRAGSSFLAGRPIGEGNYHAFTQSARPLRRREVVPSVSSSRLAPLSERRAGKRQRSGNQPPSWVLDATCGYMEKEKKQEMLTEAIEATVRRITFNDPAGAEQAVQTVQAPTAPRADCRRKERAEMRGEFDRGPLAGLIANAERHIETPEQWQRWRTTSPRTTLGAVRYMLGVGTPAGQATPRHKMRQGGSAAKNAGQPLPALPRPAENWAKERFAGGGGEGLRSRLLGDGDDAAAGAKIEVTEGRARTPRGVFASGSASFALD